jgi:transcriptional regulator with XRE-family HTH domain
LICILYASLLHNLPTMNIGTKVKRIREIRNFSQGYMAERLGISQSNYARMENNEVAISDERLLIIADILNTDENVIKRFDENIIFNITQGDNSAAGPHCVVHNYQISPEIKVLYEDKINLLVEKIQMLEEALSKHESKYKSLD